MKLDVKELVNKVTNSLEWKYYTTVTGTTQVNLPAKFNELYVIFSPTQTDNWYRTMIVPRAVLTTTSKYFFCGDKGYSTDGFRGSALFTKTTAQAYQIIDGPNDVTGSSQMIIYYR